jgi:hypothetical protein
VILLLLLVVVILGAAGAGLLGFGVLSDDRRRERSGLLAALSAPVILVAGLALLAVLALGLRGQPSGDGDAPTAAPATTGPSRARNGTAQLLPSARLAQVAAKLPVVVIEPADENRFSPYRPVSGLAPGSVLRVQARGFGWFERGQIEQCVTELDRRSACAEPFPVQFDDRGRADFQFSVGGDFAPGGCRAGQATCLLRLTGTESGRVGTVQTVLVDQLVPGQVRVEPGRGLAERQTVEVSVTGFSPGTTANAVLCAPPEPYDARRCTAPGPSSTFAVDVSGRGHTTIVVAAGRLGPGAAVCGPRRSCGVAVVEGPGFIAAPAAPVAFALGPGVAYEAGRLTLGIAVALSLIAVAVVLARRTDWTKPTEAATPALDSADLRADRTLDELFGTEEELDERDPIPW